MIINYALVVLFQKINSTCKRYITHARIQTLKERVQVDGEVIESMNVIKTNILENVLLVMGSL